VYSTYDGRLSKKLLNSLSFVDLGGFIPQGEGHYFEFLRDRISFANDWFQFLKEHNFNYGLFKFGWYLNH
jgi:hypothetical protein